MTLSFNAYQKAAASVSQYQGDTGSGVDFPVQRVTVLSLGISGEAGEVSDYIKKVLYHGHKYDRAKLMEELGDVLWYVSEGASAIGVSLSEIAARNVEKLQKRYPNGWDPKRSQDRGAP